MTTFVNNAKSISSRKLHSYNSGEIAKEEANFQTWKNAVNKHEVDRFYQSAVFGIIYVKNLYKCRVESFVEVLRDASIDVLVKNVMTNTGNIVSIGCGPGPEIAAYIDFVRTICGNRLFLNITAVDAVSHWKDFVEGMKNCDRSISITFQNAFVDANYLRMSYHSGVCLMSYPESINFNTNFWTLLKNNFDLIIILDQSKVALHSTLRQCGYTINSMEFKGTKHYAIHIKSRQVLPVSYIGHPYQPNPSINTHSNHVPRSPTFNYVNIPQPSVSRTPIPQITRKEEESFLEKCGNACAIL